MISPPAAEVADEPIDALDAATRRDSRKGAGVDVIVLAENPPSRAESIGAGLLAQVRSLGRGATLQLVPARAEQGLGRALERALANSSLPLVLITTAIEPWTLSHLKPLFEAIELADHVIGRRPAGFGKRLGRRAAALGRAIVFALPVRDIHSPCRLHRREALAAIPLQSESRFVEVEILAKGNFLTQLLTEVDVPALAAGEEPTRDALYRLDRRDLFLKPVFRRDRLSRPPEDPQRDQEGGEAPGAQDQEGGADGHEASALENDATQSSNELRER
jgi:hypothetical protein